MHLSILTPIIVFLLAAGSSYAITRPIGNSRRHVGALVVVLALGFIGGVIGGVFQAIAFETALAISVGSSALGGLIGVLIAWRQRNPLQQPQSQSKPQRQSSRRPHYGVSRG